MNGPRRETEAEFLAALQDREQRGDRLTPYEHYLKLWARGKLEKAIHQARKESQRETTR